MHCYNSTSGGVIYHFDYKVVMNRKWLEMLVNFAGSDGFDRRVGRGAGSLREGVEFRVLKIFCQSDGVNQIRIQFSEIELPSSSDSRLFIFSSNKIPQEFRIFKNGKESFNFGPEGWAVKLYDVVNENLKISYSE